MKTRVGVIGLGVLGSPVAERLIGKGFDVAVFDVRDEPMTALASTGATACASPAEVAARSEHIISLVADEAQTDEVVCGTGGVLSALQPGTTLIVCSTLGPGPVQRIAAALAAQG